MSYTIAEIFTLPSRGKIYDVPVSEQVKLRSMTLEEEMQRLSHTDSPYKTLCDIIDACMVEPIGISSYDMHLGDYQFLLHRLRVVTYGSSYSLSSICPICGRQNKMNINLDEIPTFDIDTEEKLEEFKKLFTITLPKSGNVVKLKFQTPRDMDEILRESKDFSEKNPDVKLNMEYLYNLQHMVESVDNKKITPVLLDIFLRKLPMADSNAIIKASSKINDKVGIDSVIKNVCTNPRCGAKYNTTFRITTEFFGPTDD